MTTKSLLTLLFASCLSANEIPQNIIDNGEKTAQSLIKKLAPKLKHELKTNGIMSAAKFCSENAYILTEDVNLHQLEGTSVRRISLKERNPANAPTADEKAILEKMHTLHSQKKLPKYMAEKTAQGYKYYKPLVIKKPVCLKCHGDISQNEELSVFFHERYPNDKALNYKMNDLRGVILVEMKH